MDKEKNSNEKREKYYTTLIAFARNEIEEVTGVPANTT